MDVVKYEMEVPKEGKEVIDFLAGIIKHFKEKKSVAEIGALLPGGMAAFDGYDKLGAEFKSNNRDELIGYLVHKLMGELAPVKEETVE